MVTPCVSPVLTFRSAVVQSEALQEEVLKAGPKADFIEIAEQSCYSCSPQDICSFVDEMLTRREQELFGPGTLPLQAVPGSEYSLEALGDGTLPLAQGDGTLPLRTTLALLTLLSSLVHTLELQDERSLNASQAMSLSRNWILPFWQIVGNG